jgi:hypothetical protein
LACPLPPVCEIAEVVSAVAAMARTAAEVRSDFMADLLQSKICEILQAMPEPCLDTGQITRGVTRLKPDGTTFDF